MINKLRKQHFKSLEYSLKNSSWIRFPYYISTHFLTLLGKIIIIIACISAPLTFVAFNTTAYAFFTSISALIVFSFIYTFFFRPYLIVSRALPTLIETGKEIKYYINLKNPSNRSFFSLRVRELIWSTNIKSENERITEKLEAHKDINHEIAFTITKRGSYYSEGVLVSSSFPFGLFNWGKKHNLPSKVFAFPSYERIEELDIRLGRKFQPGGISLSSNVGDSTEFTGTRDFVYGDNPKYIHWRSWARTGKPVIKEFNEEYFVRLGIVLDIFAKNDDYFEKALSYIASITDYLSRYDYIVDIFAVGNSFYHFQSGRSISYFENILELLASIEPDNGKKTEDFESIYNNFSPYTENLSSVIIALMDWDEKREKFVKNLLDNGVGVKVNIFNNNLTKKISDDFKVFVTQIV
jgi:uncharacterized protein (DUF58 family)